MTRDFRDPSSVKRMPHTHTRYLLWLKILKRLNHVALGFEIVKIIEPKT